MLSFNDPYLCAICACCSGDLSWPRISRTASAKSKSSLNRGSSKTVPSQPSTMTRITGSRETNTRISTPLRPSCRSATALFIRCSASWRSNGLQSRCPRCRSAQTAPQLRAPFRRQCVRWRCEAFSMGHHQAYVRVPNDP